MAPKASKREKTFEERMEAWGKRFGERMERLGKRFEKKADKGEWSHPSCAQDCCFSPNVCHFSIFSLLGPLIGSIIGLAMLVLCLWLLKFANVVLASSFIIAMIVAVEVNLQWFFAFSLIIGYSKYFIKAYPPSAWVLWPFSNGLGMAFFVWIIAWVFRQIGQSAGNLALFGIGAFIRGNLVEIFALFFVLGLVLMPFRAAVCKMRWC